MMLIGILIYLHYGKVIETRSYVVVYLHQVLCRKLSLLDDTYQVIFVSQFLLKSSLNRFFDNCLGPFPHNPLLPLFLQVLVVFLDYLGCCLECFWFFFGVSDAVSEVLEYLVEELGLEVVDLDEFLPHDSSFALPG